MMLNAPPRGICVTLNEHNLAHGVPGTSRSSGLAVRDLISSQPIVKSLDRSFQNLFAERSSHWNVTFIRIHTHCFVSSLDLNLHSTVYWINYVFQLNEKSTDSRIHCSLQFFQPLWQCEGEQHKSRNNQKHRQHLLLKLLISGIWNKRVCRVITASRGLVYPWTHLFVGKIFMPPTYLSFHS